MAVLYPGTSVSGYNANPPPDDGSTGSNNLIQWNNDVKAKVGDPLNNFATSVDSNITAAFLKTLDGATVVSTGVSLAVTSAYQGRLIYATASGITITTPDATAVGAPFVFAINNQSTGTITLAGGGSGPQTVDGQTTQVIQIGGSCIVKTDGSNWFTVGLKSGTISLGGNNYGFDSPINLNLVASSINTNTLLQVAVKTKAGNDPSASDPVLIPFRDATIANGDPVWLTITSALNINTNATGATLGTQNSVPFRFWILMFNNAGTPELALWHSGAGSSSIVLNPLNEGVVKSTTGISSGATSAGVFYTPNGVSLSSCAFRIIGFLDYSSGLTTAGTYASAPTTVQLFGPGIKKPGDIVQNIYMTTTTSTNINSSSAKVATALANSISPTSSSNLIRVQANGYIRNAGSGIVISMQLYRATGTTAIGQNVGVQGNSTVNTSSFVGCRALDLPGTTSSTQYGLYGILNSGSSTNTFLDNTSFTGTPTGDMSLEEIMA